MCLAVVATTGELQPETCRIAAINNPDGFGYAFKGRDLDGREKVFIRKALTYGELESKFWDEFDAHGKATPFLVHWRLGTHGLMSAENSHPYRLANGGALIHNGVLDIPAIPKEWSDTRWLVRAMLNKLPENWQRSPVWVDVVHEYIGGWNKLAGLWANEEILIVNEKQGEWRSGTWFSNDSGDKVNDWRAYVGEWEAAMGEEPILLPSGARVERGITIAPEDGEMSAEEWWDANEALLREMEEEEGKFVYA